MTSTRTLGLIRGWAEPTSGDQARAYSTPFTLPVTLYYMQACDIMSSTWYHSMHILGICSGHETASSANLAVITYSKYTLALVYGTRSYTVYGRHDYTNVGKKE